MKRRNIKLLIDVAKASTVELKDVLIEDRSTTERVVRNINVIDAEKFIEYLDTMLDGDLDYQGDDE